MRNFSPSPKKNNDNKNTGSDLQSEEIDQSLAIAILALGLTFLGIGISRIPQLLGFVGSFYFYTVGMSIMIFYIMYSLRRSRESFIELIEYMKSHKKFVVSSFFIIALVIFITLNFTVKQATSYTFHITINNNSTNYVSKVGRIKQYADTVTYLFKITPENVKHANLTIMFVSPLIFENGSVTQFYFDLETKEITTPEPLTFNKAGSVDYVYIFIYVNGEASTENREGEITINIVPK
ncbi:MAG: hypothetical protein H0Z28_13110 [Archaeoglobus sp.]|nr:hypothetical protein [Archaeoglobus sp.]